MTTICFECGAEMTPAAQPLETEYRGVRMSVSGIEHEHCSECGEDMIPAHELDKLDEAIRAEYRRIVGLLSPAEIRSLRQSLGLTQEQFQVVLGVGKTTVSRWETGRVVQLKPEDNLMRAMLDHPDFAQELIQRSGVLAAQA